MSSEEFWYFLAGIAIIGLVAWIAFGRNNE